MKKIYKGNDWGKVFYTTEELGPTHSASKADKRLHPGAELPFRFPDGRIDTREIVGRKYVTSVSDHGKPYSVSGTRLVVVETVRGIDMDIDISELEVML